MDVSTLTTSDIVVVTALFLLLAVASSVYVLIRWAGDGLGRGDAVGGGQNTIGVLNPGYGSTSTTDCASSRTYCFTDNECRTLCSQGGLYSCVSGVCVDPLAVDPSEEQRAKCSTQWGLYAYFVGDVLLGQYDARCLSIDQGIALGVEKNSMCRGGKIDIDYRKQFPTSDMCTCDDPDLGKMAISSNANMREYVVCSPYYKMLSI